MARRTLSIALFLAFVLVPVVEIALFIQVGGWIGLWPTLLIILLTALVGTILMRAQGLAVLRELRQRVDQRRNPAGPLVHGVLILVAGALLLTPGFFTDACGFLLLVPPVRSAIVAGAMRRATHVVIRRGARAPEPQGPDIVEGDFEPVEPVEPRSRPEPGRTPSGWTRPR